MSDRSNALTPEHFAYVATHARGDDAFLLELKRAARAEGIPPIWIAPEQAAFVRILFAAARACEVVEVGTLAGYAAIQMARALPQGGRVRTIELDPRHARFAREWVAQSNVAGKVEVLEGNAVHVLATLADGSADAMLVDADKGGYPAYLDHAVRIVRPGGLVLFDNAFAFGEVLEERPRDREAVFVQRFNELLARDPRVESVIVPLGDGLWVGVRR